MTERIAGEALVVGAARAKAIVTTEPLSFWGGYDPATGKIIDRRHPLFGRCVTGKVLAIPFTIGSSTSTAILLESIRAGTAPAAILCSRRDSFLALASLVAAEMYGRPIPVVAIRLEDLQRLRSGQVLAIDEQGGVAIETKRNGRS